MRFLQQERPSCAACGTKEPKLVPGERAQLESVLARRQRASCDVKVTPEQTVKCPQ